MQKSLPALLAVVALALVIGAFTLLGRGALSQRPAQAAAQIGRYQLTLASTGSQYIIDTQTGRLWYRYSNSAKIAWQEQSPDYQAPMIVAKPDAR